MNKTLNIAFIGAGNMAKAIIGGLVESGYPAEKISVSAPSQTHRMALANIYGIHQTDHNVEVAKSADIVIFAVKPQIMKQVCLDLKKLMTFEGKLILSLASGISVDHLAQWLGDSLPIVRIMPNTPCSIRQGMSGLYANPHVSDGEKQITSDLLACVSDILWLNTEDQINDIIAVAGSAPAYLFYFMEAMQNKAMELGFDEQSARHLVEKTILGSANLVASSPELSLTDLREQVTSKGGTTEQAIKIFKQEALSGIVSKAMDATILRAKEMESLFS